MGLQAELTIRDGLVDDSGQPSENPPYDGAFADFLATPGVSGSDVAVAFKQALTQAAQETAEGVGLWESLRRFFRAETHKVVAVDNRAVELEGYWMTLPEVMGASVKLSVSVSSSSETSASFTIAGIGGGPTFTIDLKEGLNHEASRCERVVLSAVGTFQKIEVVRRGNVIGTYPRLISLDRANLTWKFDPAVPPPVSGLGASVATRGYDQSDSDGATIATLEIDRGTAWDVSAGISLPNFGGIGAQISAKVIYQRDVGVEYTLPGRHYYRATRFANFPAYLWTVR
jgi:hypothetical protein